MISGNQNAKGKPKEETKSDIIEDVAKKLDMMDGVSLNRNGQVVGAKREIWEKIREEL